MNTNTSFLLRAGYDTRAIATMTQAPDDMTSEELHERLDYKIEVQRELLEEHRDGVRDCRRNRDARTLAFHEQGISDCDRELARLNALRKELAS